MTSALDTRADPRVTSVREDHSGELANGSTDASTRGGLTIADKVVEKIASYAVNEVDLATGSPRTVLGVHLGSADGEDKPRADASVDGGLVTVAVTMAVQWPAPVRQVCDQVRSHVTERITALTGLEVAEVDVDVPTLVTGRKRPPRVQ